jgi:opacity protein-like surface antigen
MRLAFLLPALLVPLTPALGQESAPGKLGINLRVQNSPQIGFDLRVSSKVTLRPELSFRWQKTEGLFGDQELTQYAVGLDVLVRAASWDRVTSYYGIGASIGAVTGPSSLAGDAWAARLLVGARIRVVERVAVFGEVGVAYADAEGFFGKQFELQTFPLGVTVYLK